MRLRVAGGRVGAAQAAEQQCVAVIVDALRASATTASLLHYGVKEIIVVEGVEEAFAERDAHPGALLAGERGGLKVEGFDLGNSPLQAPLSGLSETLVFSSSNMSRCCVGAANCPATFLGTLVTRTACAALAMRTAADLKRDIMLVLAGSALDECKFVLEDYIAAGALLESMMAGEFAAMLAGDAARAALDLYHAAAKRGLEESFLATDNGTALVGMGFASDVRFAAHIDAFTTVPRVQRTYQLDSGSTAAVLTPA